MSYNSIKIVPADEVDVDLLAEFFDGIKGNKSFQPHSFELDDVIGLYNRTKDNLFYCLTDSDEVIAYGFLRGWDEKWDDICLGIVVRESYWGNGYGEMFMMFLHSAARYRKTQRLRLHVNPNNTVAFNLYNKLGYRFNGQMHNNERVGYYDIYDS